MFCEIFKTSARRIPRFPENLLSLETCRKFWIENLRKVGNFFENAGPTAMILKNYGRWSERACGLTIEPGKKLPSFERSAGRHQACRSISRRRPLKIRKKLAAFSQSRQVKVIGRRRRPKNGVRLAAFSKDHGAEAAEGRRETQKKGGCQKDHRNRPRLPPGGISPKGPENRAARIADKSFDGPIWGRGETIAGLPPLRPPNQVSASRQVKDIGRRRRPKNGAKLAAFSKDHGAEAAEGRRETQKEGGRQKDRRNRPRLPPGEIRPK